MSADPLDWEERARRFLTAYLSSEESPDFDEERLARALHRLGDGGCNHEAAGEPVCVESARSIAAAYRDEPR